MDAAARDELRGLFELQTSHGQGPTSLVCLARDLEYDQAVALKVMPRAPHAGPEVEEAFHRAAAAVAALDHPGIVPLYSAGATDRFFWCSMEYVEGRSLAESLRSNGPMELSVCLRLVDQVAAALDAAHGLGIVHADLTPANVLIDEAGDARVTDFWVPWVLEQLGALGGSGSRARGRDYRGPEVSSAREPGPQADQYSLAVLVYQCLSGKLPAVENPLKAIAQGRRPPPPPRLVDVRPDIPAHVSEAVECALTPAPDARFPSVLDFAAALQGLAPAAATGIGAASAVELPVLLPSPDPADAAADLPRASRWRWVLGGACALVILGVASPWLLSSGSTTDGAGAPSPDPLSPESSYAPLDTTVRTPAAPGGGVDLAPATGSPSTRPLRRPAPLIAPGRLFVNATPWGEVYIDDHLIGNTPRADVAVPPGAHRVRVVRDGFLPYDITIRVAPGQELRITDIVLPELKP